MNPKDYMKYLCYNRYSLGGDANHAHVEEWVSHVGNNAHRMNYDCNNSHVRKREAVLDQKSRQERHEWLMKNDSRYRREVLEDESIERFQAFMEYT